MRFCVLFNASMCPARLLSLLSFLTPPTIHDPISPLLHPPPPQKDFLVIVFVLGFTAAAKTLAEMYYPALAASKDGQLKISTASVFVSLLLVGLVKNFVLIPAASPAKAAPKTPIGKGTPAAKKGAATPASEGPVTRARRARRDE
jgi:hypothetical protein